MLREIIEWAVCLLAGGAIWLMLIKVI
jgi:hypothetical protein